MSLLTSRGTVRADAPAPWDCSAVDALLARFLADKEQASGGPEIAMFVELLEGFLSGGKRLRPLLCYYGWQAAGGHGGTIAVTHLGAALELFHAGVLIHDDVMDGSDVRRGRPTVHRTLAGSHARHASPDRFGVNMAILLGDLALCWSYDLLQVAELATPRAGTLRALLDAMRLQAMTGQYLDLLATGSSAIAVEEALAICRAKTARYTVEYPLLAGAHLAGADQGMLAACSAYGVPLGEAFQLRDDLLGVFGDPGTTGKSDLDDLRDGKHTVLLAIARQRADSVQAGALRALIGNARLDRTGAQDVRDILVATGARDAVEDMIDQRRVRALTVLDSFPFPAAAAASLRHLADMATRRDH
ncbi:MULTISPECIES: polyprenyl synthetase family protein [Streptomyces]|uniref:Geranylgeranyl pyrophosphate synthase n=2 Tax=Streptomyces TaxID=1883 RepID=A0ABQ3TMP9_9ACTN|nr:MULTISPECIES: polyprenyl synthetase family protein [Streptomyces]MCM9078017.1 polyprenyl synthetase family protein [Streptomyces spororaveus]MCX5307568.1 polyprenyl synthetase family protein [Streptomyces sp. NBC_00160]GHI81691.1 geranylgeranyl pyrophosphate synthase [Streptomyces spororaveus]